MTSMRALPPVFQERAGLACPGRSPAAGSRVAGTATGPPREAARDDWPEHPCCPEAVGKPVGDQVAGRARHPDWDRQERTERDAEWENAHPHGHGDCYAVDRDAYRTPWRLAAAPAPVVALCAEAALAQAAQVAALHAQVDRLVDLLLYYRHLAAGHTEADPLPLTQGPGREAPVLRRLRQ